jgi:predicted DNA repair protein MutK
MPGGSLLLLLDDLALMAKQAAVSLDDIAIQTGAASKKAVGIVVDDTAVSAGAMVNFDPKRELPVVLAVAKGSAWNKAKIIPAALVLSAVAPWSIQPLLMLGGAFLCYEGVHKILHRNDHHADEHKIPVTADPVQFEQEKIKGAVQTDFILSAEILAMTLAAVAVKPLFVQFGTLTAVAVIMTVGVYGIVAGLVKLDDAGLALAKRSSKTAQWVGGKILKSAPILFKALAILGTAAMIYVGGGILAHGVPALHHMAQTAGTLMPYGEVIVGFVSTAGVGLLAGFALANRYTARLFAKLAPYGAKALTLFKRVLPRRGR